MRKEQQAIGIFDSGIGGLTVARAVASRLPNEKIIYFGDTARVPYGIKSEEVIERYAREITRFLKERRVKAILIACNSVSAVAGQAVREEAEEIPVLDVITAGTESAVASGAVKTGVIGTLATIGSGAYNRSLEEAAPGTEIVSQACPLLVPLAEEGWTDNEIAMKTLELYLNPFLNNGVGALILGCTHYPLFRDSIQALFKGRDIRVIDSADAIAGKTEQMLKERGLRATDNTEGGFECYVTDRPQRFQELATRFLGRNIPDVKIVHLP
ncbi:MAG: glutamate racemase [Balneolaceae bacterium]